jgi:hypothetical protein
MKKSVLLGFLIMILSGTFLALRPAAAMPIGTLLYRTSADGEMYGYNTGELFQPLAVSLQKGLQTMKINCGHAGMYVGKINGEDMVLEAISNGVQLTPAKYFVDTGEGEKLLGARIPKGMNADKGDKINALAAVIGSMKLSYDWGFSSQKGPGDGQWICVGLTEKIYESLNNFLTSSEINSDKVLQKFEYDPAKYAINITPDGFDNASVFNRTNGDCLSFTKEFSKISQRDWEPAYVLGKITEQGRYFFLPYTQFVQPTLQDVDVDIPVASDFAAENIRGKMPPDKVIKVVLKNTVLNNPVQTVANAYLALTMPLSPVKSLVSNSVAAAIDLFTPKPVLPTSSLAAQTDTAGKVLAATDDNNQADKSTPAATVLESNQTAAALTVPAKKTTAKKISTAKSSVKKSAASATTSASIIVPTKTIATTSPIIPPAKAIPKQSTTTPAVAKITPVYQGSVGVSPRPGDPESDNPAASSTQSTTTPQSKPAPIIKSFSLANSANSSSMYSGNRNIAVKSEIENSASVEKYALSESSTTEIIWFNILPANYNLSAGDGQKTVRLQIKYNTDQATSALASIILDTAPPTVELLNLPATSNNPAFTVAWQGSDSNGIAGYRVDYAISDSSSTPSAWQTWLADTAATSSIFNQAVPADNYVFFRVKSTDRAGNLSAWSQTQAIKIIKKIIYEHTALISEFTIAGPGGAGDEFVELYNPGKKSFSLAGWKLQTRNANATSSWINRTPDDGLAAITIPAQGYFLFAGNDYSLNTSPDYRHGSSLGMTSSGGSIRIINDQGQEIDEVSFGRAAESSSALAATTLASGLAAERKAAATSTSATMVYPGDHSLSGNGYDTDSDSDFVINQKANPQNSASAAEPPSLIKITPLAVADLSVDTDHIDPHTIKLLWSAPPFANLDSSSKYIIKYVIQSSNCNLPDIWDGASSVALENLPTPSTTGGADEQAIITGLFSGEQYCFALQTFNGYNFSPLSNLASGNTKVIRSAEPDIQTMVDQEVGENYFSCGDYGNWSGQSFIATQNNITGFEVASQGYHGGTPDASLIELCDNTPDNYYYSCPNAIKSEYLPDSTIYNFTNTAELIIGHSYLIKIHSRGYAYAKFLLSSGTNPYPDGQAFNAGGDVPNTDMWIKIYYDHNFQP